MARRPILLLTTLVVLASCGPSRAPSTGRPSASPAVGEAANAAFVVVGADETWLVPVDPDVPVVHAPGIWLLDETDGTVVRPTPTPESRGRAICRAQGAPDECSTAAHVRLRDELEATLDPACSCFVGDDTVRCDDDPFAFLAFDAWEASTGVTFAELLEFRRGPDADDAEYGGNDELEEDDETGCEESGARVVSLHAGTLYSEVFEHDGCRGWNIYDTTSEATPLTGDARAFGLRDGSELRCDPDGAFVEGWASRTEASDLELRDGRWHASEGYDEDDAEAHERCRGYQAPDGAVVFQQGPYLLVAAAEIDASGGGARFSSRLPLGPETCTSADPCGSAAGFVAFEGMADDQEIMESVYVANDASAALALAGRQLYVYRPNDALPSRTEPFASELVGIRFHADASRLARAMQLEALHEASDPMPEGGCADGRASIDGACAVHCEGDLDCRGAMGCEAVCRAGVCSDAPVECNDAHPCGVDAVCRDRRCEALTLDETDADFEDTRGGSGWGNRCIAHLRAGRLDAAQAACVEGLRLATRDGTRGALLYNLGLVAERRGDRTSARLDYEASLRARPNATVARALAAASGPVAP